MKETKPVEIAKKHREDVIDTLQLRHKERKVLYALLLILLATVAYENSTYLYDRLIGTSHPLPELGQRKKAQLRPELLKPLKEALAEAAEDFPQYWARFALNRKRLADAHSLLAEEGMSADALENVRLVLVSMTEFSAHPLIMPTKNLTRLNQELTTLQKILKLKVEAADAVPAALVFTRETSAAVDQRPRNLFEYSLR
jgi:hypothetical protein